MSGCVEECLIDVGKMLGVKQIIIGSFGRLGNMYTVNAKLVYNTSGKILKTSDFETQDWIVDLATLGMKIVASELAGITLIKKTSNQNEIKESNDHSLERSFGFDKKVNIK